MVFSTSKEKASKRSYKNVRANEQQDTGENELGYPDSFNGPLRERKVTDPLFALLLFLTWLAAGGIGYWALENGDPFTLILPFDYKGRYCGMDVDSNGVILPSFYYPVDVLGNGVCVNKCPEQNLFKPNFRSELHCKDDEHLLEMIGCSWNEEIVNDVNQLVVCGGCMFQVDSIQAMNFCVPRSVIELLQQVDVIANATGFDPIQKLDIPEIIPFMERFAQDIWNSITVVLGFGIGVAMAFGLIFLVLLRIPALAELIIWGAAISTPVLLFFGGYYCRQLGKDMQENPPDLKYGDTYVKVVEYLVYVLYIGAAIIACLLLFLRRRIQLAISLNKAAAKAVIAFPLTVVYPIFQLGGYLILIVPWFIIMIFLSGTGEAIEKTQEIFSHNITYTSYDYTPEVKFGFCFMIFTLFWSSEFILAMGQISLAMCYSNWYFTAHKDEGIDSNVFTCTCLSFIYHMGTAAFGSMILAIVRFIRAILLWLQKKVKESGLDNKFADVAFCCCRCCLSCLEKCLKYLSKNAYIETALFSYSFCRASQQSFLLIFRNAARMFAIGVVSDLSMIYCKLFIVSGVTVSSYFFLTEHLDAELYSALSVVGVVGLLSWFVANMFLEVLGIAITTVLHCFLADEEVR